MAKILVPVDYAECSRAALRLAASIGVEHGVRVDVVHVCSGANLPTVAAGVSVSDGADADAFVQQEALDELRAFVAATLRNPSAVDTRVVIGPVVDVIVQLADTGNYDMVIVGARGKSRLRTFVFGSVTTGVVERARCSVLAVKEGDALPGWLHGAEGAQTEPGSGTA